MIDALLELDRVDLRLITRLLTACAGDSAQRIDNDGLSLVLSAAQLRRAQGNEALLSAGLLDSLIEKSEPGSLLSARIRRNPLLPESAVLQKLDLLGVMGTVCGNAGGDPECFCIVG
ncbi:MAG TPA: hypothetical protein ENJ18_12415 [Nannocystis exedens]|nr:hypothetical protein [Nannocystis exedens]